MRGTGATFRDALDEAFKRTGVPRDQFKVTKWGRDQNGKSVPVEYSGLGGANVNMDIPQWNNVKPNGSIGAGPHQPHIGYQTPGKGSSRVRDHIFTITSQQQEGKAMSNADEIVNVGKELGIKCSLLAEVEGKALVSKVLDKFEPFKVTGHLAIDRDSISIPLEGNEFSYSERLDNEDAFIFFDQEGDDRKRVVHIEDARTICRIMENSFGMEYFLSNKNATYLVAVNWYTIEVAGTLSDRFADLV
ncbi:hypothetical protein KW548_17700 [Vibrio neptunius]|nr:hypothetical protein KW548_17700 [Vibrio neptunius]